MARGVFAVPSQAMGSAFDLGIQQDADRLAFQVEDVQPRFSAVFGGKGYDGIGIEGVGIILRQAGSLQPAAFLSQ